MPSSDADTFVAFQCSLMILCRLMLRRVGETKRPCLPPAIVLKHSPTWPKNSTVLCALSCRFSMTHIMLVLILYFLKAAPKASCHIVGSFLNKDR